MAGAFSCQPLWAGGWSLDRYEVLTNSTGEIHQFQPQFGYPFGGITGGRDKVQSLDAYYGYGSQASYPRYQTIPSTSQYTRVSESTRLNYEGATGQQPASWPNFKMSPGTAEVTLTVTPVFKWVPSGDNDPPGPEFWIWESSKVDFSHGNSDPFRRYSEQNPYTAANFSLSQLNLGLGGQPSPLSSSHPSYNGTPIYSGLQGSSSVTRPKLMNSRGAAEVYGATRTLKAGVKSPGWNSNDLGRDWYGAAPSASATASLQYQAGVARFSLDVETNVINWLNTHPRNKELNAYANKVWKGVDNPGDAITANWEGPATYSANLSSDLLNTIGNPEYHWNFSGTWADGIGNESTATVSRNHFLDYAFHDGRFSALAAPQTTEANLIVQGNNAETGLLTAKAKINWYEQPFTKLRTETYVVIQDENGPHRYDSIEAALSANGEEEQINAYIAEIRGAYTETLDTGIELVGTALEIEMAIGSWYVPDETDAALAAAAGVGKLFKIAKKAAKFTEIVGKLNSKLSPRIDQMHAAMAARRGNANFSITVRQKLTATQRGGKLPPGAQRSRERTGVIDDVVVCRKAGSCFVKGTLVSVENGQRAIETLQKGDLVWSRDESSGATQLKPIAQTFERYAATLALKFSNGETVETTSEHPFYVVGRGFVKAGELGIGSSIVTRAGPSVALKAATAGKAQTVYNFEVADYHT